MVGPAEQLAMDHMVSRPTKFREKNVVLKGPYSPLEMHLYSKMQSLIGYNIRVQDDSVNSVILDDRPSDRHDRLLVATQVP